MRRLVARYLGVDIGQIVRCEEWITVLFVIVKGWRPTFLSKKILQLSPQFLSGDVVASQAGSYYEVINQLKNRVRCSPLDITLHRHPKIGEELVFPTKQLTIISSPKSTKEELQQVKKVVTVPVKSSLTDKASLEVVRASVGVN